jgi:hypothetical protein
MAASNPIRIDRSLFEQAAAEADRQKRSTPKQVEYWAELGQVCDGLLSHADAVRLREGLLKLEPCESTPVNAEDVFTTLDANRDDGSLSHNVTTAKTIYQVSDQHPGYLEQIEPEGNVIIGQFERGKFRPKR